jgi:exonuclease III
MRIASWNLSSYRLADTYNLSDFDKPEDVDYFLDVLETNKFDVLCLQENFANVKESYSEKICKRLNFDHYFDSLSNTSFCDSRYGETISIISKHKIQRRIQIANINPSWEMTLPNGSFARSYDKWFQVASINGVTICNAHFIPEKTFGMDYSKGRGVEYFHKNLSLLNKVNFGVLCADFNTVSLEKLTQNFRKAKKLENAFENVPTRPISENKAVINDAIFYKKKFKILDKGVILTKNDHYLIWVDIEK